MAWLGTWANRARITIDNANVDSDLSDFPVLIHISASSGSSSEDISAVFDELTSDANRKKIAVTEDDEVTQCYVEIEKWDDANEQAWLHVKVPSVTSGSTTTIYLYYDSAQADNTSYVGDTTDAVTHNVWDANFMSVWHMAQDPDGDGADAIKDSTSGGHDTTPAGSMTTADLVDAKVGKGIDFEGTDDRLYGADSADWDFSTNDFTLEAIIYITDDLTGPIDTRRIMSRADLASVNGAWYWGFGINSGWPSGHRMNMAARSGGTIYNSNSDELTINTSTYYHLVARKVSGTIYYYVDGVASGSDALNYDTDGDQPLNLGVSIYSAAYHEFMKGVLDELRVSDTSRSAAWIKATFYSLDDDIMTFDLTMEGSLTEGLSMGDTVTPDLYSENLIEGTVLSDAVVGDHLVVALTEGIKLGDTIATEIDFSTAILEGALMGDSMVPNHFVVALAEGIIMSDTIAPEMEYLVSLAEGILVGDTVASDHYVVSLTEGIVLSDTWVRTLEFIKTLTEGAVLSDAFVGLNWTDWLEANAEKATKQYYLTLTGDAATSGTSVSSSSASQNMSQYLAYDKFNIAVDGGAAIEITCDWTGAKNGNLIATQIGIQMAASAYPSINVSFDFVAGKYTFYNTANLSSTSTIVITHVPYTDATEKLRIGLSRGGTETTGTDGISDIEIPMKSFQGRLNNEKPTWLSCVIPGIVINGVDYSAEINARTNGDIKIEMAYVIDGAVQQREVLVEVDFENIRIYEGATNQTITIDGHRTETFVAKTVIMEDSTYYNLNDGRILYRFPEPDLFLRPGDTVQVRTDEYIVGVITYYIDVDRQQMELTEDA